MEMQWDHAIDGERIGPGSTPMLSLKVAYFLTDTTAPDCGAMKCVPGSHLSDERPDGVPGGSGGDARQQPNGMAEMPGAIDLAVPAGSAVLFDRRLW